MGDISGRGSQEKTNGKQKSEVEEYRHQGKESENEHTVEGCIVRARMWSLGQ